MFVTPTDAFLDKKKVFTPDVQGIVRRLISQTRDIALTLCDLPIDYQNIRVTLDSHTKLRFIFVNDKQPTLIIHAYEIKSA